MLKVTKLFPGRDGTNTGQFVLILIPGKSYSINFLLQSAIELMRHFEGKDNVSPPSPFRNIFSLVTEDKHWERIPLYIETGIKRKKKTRVDIYIFMMNMV